MSASTSRADVYTRLLSGDNEPSRVSTDTPSAESVAKKPKTSSTKTVGQFVPKQTQMSIQIPPGFAPGVLAPPSTAQPTHPQTSTAVRFGEMYAENWTRLAPTKTYGVDVDAVKAWQAGLGKTGAADKRRFERMFGRLVAENIQHISFAQFYETLRRVAFEVRGRAAELDALVVLFVPYPDSMGAVYWKKSNFWVSLLIWPFICDLVIDVIDDTGLGAYVDQAGQPKHLFVLADDGIFSGQQMVNHMLKLTGVAAHDAVMIAAAAVSTVAWSLLRDSWQPAASVSATLTEEENRGWPTLLFPSYSIRLGTLEEYANRMLADTTVAALFLRDMRRFSASHVLRGEVQPRVTFAYFDHKLPDFVSTITDLLALSTTVEAGGVMVRSLIRGCSPQDYQAQQQYQSVEFVPPVDQDNCPPVFYKGIVYTFRGRKLVDGMRTLSRILADD